MGPKQLVHAAKCIGRMNQKSFGVTHVFSDLSKVINNAWATIIYLLHWMSSKFLGALGAH